MFKIRIYKDNLTYNVLNDLTNTWEQIELKEDTGPISKYFNEEVEIMEDVTFEDLMNLMEKFESDINFCFAAHNKCIPLSIYLKEMRTDITHDIQIVELELIRKGEIISHEINTINSISGFMSEESAEILGESTDKRLSIDTYHVNSLRRSFISLNENIAYVDYGTPSDGAYSVEKVLFSGFCKWTLHDVLSTVLSVLTNNGTPDERDVVNQYEPYSFERVSKNKDDAEMWLELFQEELEAKNDQKKQAIDEELYEKVIPINLEISELEEKIKDLQGQLHKISNGEQVV